jgi:uncharacterized membrane protein
MSESEAPVAKRETAVGATAPQIRVIGVPDVLEALAKGLADFRRAPIYGLVFGALYALAGLLIVGWAWRTGRTFLAYPLAAGFALIGPFVAVGLYEVSRRLETGEPLSFGTLWSAIRTNGGRELGWMALVSVFALVIWLYVAGFLYAIFFGLRPIAFVDLVAAAFTTPHGLAFLLVGSGFGAVLALAVFSLTVVSFPLLVDRDVDFVTAMITSVRAVAANLRPMLAWGVIVGGLLAIATLPFFLGLVLVLPVLGHATWHLYRATVK